MAAMKELKHIEVMSMAKVFAVLSAIWGFIFALITVLTITPMLAMVPDTTGISFGALAVGMGFASIIIAPIVMAIIGFICGAITAFLYNVVAGWVGGVKLDL